MDRRPPVPLPPGDWSVLILRDVLGWPPADAGALLGLSEPALAGALARARADVGAQPPRSDGERAALTRLTGTTSGAVLTLTGALLREHAPPAPCRSR